MFFLIQIIYKCNYIIKKYENICGEWFWNTILSNYYFFDFSSCRDTPHHLKNKRVHHGVTDKVTNMIIANALKNQENQNRIEPLIENEAAEELKEGKWIF